MVGAAAALALARAGQQVTLIDSNSLVEPEPDWDLRISSVNDNHWQWLLSLGIGDSINWQKVNPYEGLSVTTVRGSSLTFSAQDAGRQQLGVMVENNNLQAALWQCLSGYANVSLRAPAAIECFDLQQQRLRLNDDSWLSYDVLIGADGSGSAVARAAGIGYRGWDYGQRCLLANVELQQPIEAQTWEIFRPQGPFALLPLSSYQACLIDYRSHAEISAISQHKEQLVTALEQTFHPYVGDFEVHRYASFPLQRKHALNYYRDNTLLMGDAAHSIHPLAGQGVNLGFADVRTYLAVDGDNCRYQRQRQRQNQTMMRAMDAIHVGFTARSRLLQSGLGVALKLVNQAALKKQILRQALQA